ncbi:MAG: L,D-transpeptidase, partial [Rodentibacter sp.]
MLKGTMKLNSLVLSLSMITSGCALADWSKNMTFSVPTQIDMAKLSPQEREEIEREQARLMAEKQALLEMSLTHEIGEQ